MNFISGLDPPNFKGFLKIRCLEGSKQIWFQFVEYWCFFDLFLEGIKNLEDPLNFICPPSKLHEGSKQIWSQFVEIASFFDVFLEGIKNSKDPLNFICPPNKLHEGLKQNWNQILKNLLCCMPAKHSTRGFTTELPSSDLKIKGYYGFETAHWLRSG